MDTQARDRSSRRPALPTRVHRTAALLAALSEPPLAAIPARVRREVWRRDHGMCQWPLEEGGTCGSQGRSALDPVEPRALGGPPTAANVRVLCDFHHDLAARRAFGDGVEGGAIGSPRRRAAH
ncbi:MAG TPA: hypothetical protein VMU15_04505 [Anaeromyxobacter sp.]|nr:hypothetical protein [Anaeromyxobacter sp.]